MTDFADRNQTPGNVVAAEREAGNWRMYHILARKRYINMLMARGGYCCFGSRKLTTTFCTPRFDQVEFHQDALHTPRGGWNHENKRIVSTTNPHRLQRPQREKERKRNFIEHDGCGQSRGRLVYYGRRLSLPTFFLARLMYTLGL